MHPTDDIDANAPMAGQPRTYSQNSGQLRDVSTKEAGALCRPGRTEEEEKVWSEGVSDPAPAPFGPLRAGSLTPTCLVSVVLEEAARMRVQIVTGCMPNSEPRSCPVRAPAKDVMINARAVSYRRHNRCSFFVAHRSCSRA